MHVSDTGAADRRRPNETKGDETVLDRWPSLLQSSLCSAKTSAVTAMQCKNYLLQRGLAAADLRSAFHLTVSPQGSR